MKLLPLAEHARHLTVVFYSHRLGLASLLLDEGLHHQGHGGVDMLVREGFVLQPMDVLQVDLNGFTEDRRVYLLLGTKCHFRHV